jgi:hypothetical protein
MFRGALIDEMTRFAPPRNVAGEGADKEENSWVRIATRMSGA